MNKVIKKVEELAITLAETFEDENVRMAIGEESLENIQGRLKAVDEELANPLILGDVERKIVGSFEEWDERVNGLVEFVRPGNMIIEFQIQSLTAGEMKEVRVKRVAAEPVMPVARQRGDGKADPNDKAYQKDLEIYNAAKIKQDELNVLWILERGLLFVITGKDDDEKLESLKNTVAGDAAKIASDIMDISNLSPDSMSPF